MWIFFTFGFFSAVQKPDTDYLTVRARSRKHLETLVRRHGHLGTNIFHRGNPRILGKATDYPCRIQITHGEWAAILAHEANAIAGNNFKGTVHKEGRDGYADALMQIWHVMRRAEVTNAMKDDAA